MRPAATLLVLALLAPAQAGAECDMSELPAGAEVVELVTARGSICLELLRADAPAHVENFLWYLDNGHLQGTFFHRLVDEFVLQGGSLKLGAGDYESVPPRGLVVPNEPCELDTPAPTPSDPDRMICSERGNEPGTVALAKLGEDPNSGSSSWFVNLADNRSNLDNQNGGFTVFARVIGDSMAVVQEIALLGTPTDDDRFWLTTAQRSNTLTFTPPLWARPSDDSSGFGCFDAQQIAAIADPDEPSTGLPDPVLGTFPFVVSVPCGTPTTLESFVPNPGTAQCPDADRLGVALTGPGSLMFTQQPPAYYSFPCQKTQEALDNREAWRPVFQGRFDEQLVFIESAQRVPEPSTRALGALALAVVALARGGRPVRRSSSWANREIPESELR